LRIQFTQTVNGANWSYDLGEIVEMREIEAWPLIHAGLAVQETTEDEQAIPCRTAIEIEPNETR
jgi:hypothetical protein